MNDWDQVKLAIFNKDDAERMNSRIFEKEIEGIHEVGMTEEEKLRLRKARQKYANAMRPYLEACRAAWNNYRAHQ